MRGTARAAGAAPAAASGRRPCRALCRRLLGTVLLLAATAAPAASPGEGADPIAPVILSITGLLFFALLGQSLARALGQPAVLGELLIGIALGNALYFAGLDLALILREGQGALALVTEAMRNGGWDGVAGSELAAADAEAVLEVLRGPDGGTYLRILQTVDVFAAYGLIFLLFLVGLGTSARELSQTGWDAARVALLGVAAPFALGLLAVRVLQPELGWEVAVFVAATLAATSIGITARVLTDLHQDHAAEARVILGAAVLDDVLGLVLLAVVSGIVVTGGITLLGVAEIVGRSALFFVAAYYLSPPLLRLVVYLVRGLSLPEAKLFVAFLFTMVLAWSAKALGLATIVGAFTAGVLLSDRYFTYWRGRDEQDYTIRDLISPLEMVLAPVFFIFMGIQVKLETFLRLEVLLLALALTVLGMAGKLIAGWGARRGYKRAAIGVAMMPRGEVGLIFATVGKGLGVVPDALFSAIVLMVVLTTLITPVLLKRMLGSEASPAHHD